MNKHWQQDFIDKFVADNTLDCIPEENWKEMRDEVFAFISNLIGEDKN